MAFTLHLYDRNGKELNEGDIVKISDGSRITFYAEVKFLEGHNAIAPFHTFSFSSMIKVDKLPEGLTKANEERYGILHGEPEDDSGGGVIKQYLLEWRECEHNLDDRMFKISRQ